MDVQTHLDHTLLVEQMLKRFRQWQPLEDLSCRLYHATENNMVRYELDILKDCVSRRAHDGVHTCLLHILIELNKDFHGRD